MTTMRKKPVQALVPVPLNGLIEVTGVKLTSIGLVLPDNLDVKDWEIIGLKLGQYERAFMWAIGDWWAFAEHRYGDRKHFVDEGYFGLTYQTIANCASICRAVETSRRREDLSFSHHAEVAAFDPAEQDELLGLAQSGGWSVKKLRETIKWRREAKVKHQVDAEDLAEHVPDPKLVDDVETAHEAQCAKLDTAIEKADAGEATCHDLRDCWDRAPPEERQRFVDGVSLRALFDAAPITHQEAFVAEVVKVANGGMPDIPPFLRRTKPAPAEDIAEPEEAA
jgi:hypothetical protein